MDCINEDKEVEIFIEKHGIAPTKDEKILLKLAILHGAITYNNYIIQNKLGEK